MMTLDKLNEIAASIEKKQEAYKKKICVCVGTGCTSAGSQQVIDGFQKEVQARGVGQAVGILPVGCRGACSRGPIVEVLPDEIAYQKISSQETGLLMEEQISKARLVPSLLMFSENPEKAAEKISENNFYKKQMKIVLENCGRINPESIEEYIAAGGYRALYGSLLKTQEDVIAEIKQSGLRGRGGAGFPTGLKWETVYKYVNPMKYVICNGDEGDPGAFMDRSVLEGDPHKVIEGMAIAGYAVGASKGYIYVRAEYPLAIKRLQMGIKEARKMGLLGPKIFGTEFVFDIEIRIGAGAFVCGEETALIASIEGKRGTPRPRPPYPAESGLWGKPTLINNVETLANVAPIMLRGGEWYSAIGTPKSTGTKVFAMTGKINNNGLIEVPMGITLREIIFEIGGGIPGNGRFKAAQTGGPSGGCIPEQHLDTKIDYESLLSLGSIMGSGGLIVMDEASCMVDVARFFMEFCMDESCGKCIPCRVGTKQMYDLLLKICQGHAEMKDLSLLEELAPFVKETSLCGLGMTAPNPLLSTLRYFREEYIAHIKEKKCPAGVCKTAPQ